MRRETWYVLTDGSLADPSDVITDDKGILRHREGVAVAMRPDSDVPRTRNIDVDTHRMMLAGQQQKPPAGSTTDQSPASPPPGGYVTREAGAGIDTAAEITALRAEYKAKFDKAPYHGWDAATLREKIAGKTE